MLQHKQETAHDTAEFNRISIFFKLCELLSPKERARLEDNLPGSSRKFHAKLLDRCEHIFDPATYDHQIFCSSFENILPAPIILKQLSYSSARVGILTARGARGNNQLVLQEALKALDAHMPLEFQYFLGDSEHNQRISALAGTSRKKSEVLSNLLNGVRTVYRQRFDLEGGHDFAEEPDPETVLLDCEPRYGRDGKILSFKKIVFYEDEQKNISAARKLSEQFGYRGQRLEVLDVNHFSTPLAVSQLLQALSQPPQPQDPELLHMFDIDGTLLNPDAFILLGQPHYGKLALSQEEFAEVPHDVLPNLKPDYSHFADPIKIIETIQRAKQNGILFRKKGKSQ